MYSNVAGFFSEATVGVSLKPDAESFDEYPFWKILLISEVPSCNFRVLILPLLSLALKTILISSPAKTS